MRPDNMMYGILIGAVAPLVAWVLTNFTSIVSTYLTGKETGLYFLAALINLIMARVAFKQEKSHIGRGIVFITFVLTLSALFFLKGNLSIGQ